MIKKSNNSNKNQKGRRSIFRQILLGFLVILFLGIAGFVIWGSTPAKPDASALIALESDSVITVSEGKFWLEFSPANQPTRNGLIFYPGGRVDYRAYASLMREIAAGGHSVFLVKMPLSLAVFGVNRANAVLEANPEITTWYIGGHSLGGAMASSYIYNHSDQIDGLILWASYPAENNDLSESGKAVLSIYGNRDGLTTQDKLDETNQLLPADSILIEIDGGNHAQFGSYGAQTGDLEASISADEQHRQIVLATLKFMTGERFSK